MAQVYASVVKGNDAQRPGVAKGPGDVVAHGGIGVSRFPGLYHQVERVGFVAQVNRRRHEVGIGADRVGESLFVEDEGGGGFDLEVDGGAWLGALALGQVVVLIAGRVPAQRRAALDRAREQGDLAGEQEGAEKTKAELADQLGGLLGRVKRQPFAQLAGVAPADGGEISADLVGGEAVAVVADGDGAPRDVHRDDDAWPIARLVGLDLAAHAGIVSVLDQLADTDFLAGIEVLGQHFQQAGQVQIEFLTLTHGCFLQEGLKTDDQVHLTL